MTSTVPPVHLPESGPPGARQLLAALGRGGAGRPSGAAAAAAAVVGDGVREMLRGQLGQKLGCNPHMAHLAPEIVGRGAERRILTRHMSGRGA